MHRSGGWEKGSHVVTPASGSGSEPRFCSADAAASCKVTLPDTRSGGAANVGFLKEPGKVRLADVLLFLQDFGFHYAVTLPFFFFFPLLCYRCFKTDPVTLVNTRDFCLGGSQYGDSDVYFYVYFMCIYVYFFT